MSKTKKRRGEQGKQRYEWRDRKWNALGTRLNISTKIAKGDNFQRASGVLVGRERQRRQGRYWSH